MSGKSATLDAASIPKLPVLHSLDDWYSFLPLFKRYISALEVKSSKSRLIIFRSCLQAGSEAESFANFMIENGKGDGSFNQFLLTFGLYCDLHLLAKRCKASASKEEVVVPVQVGLLGFAARNVAIEPAFCGLDDVVLESHLHLPLQHTHAYLARPLVKPVTRAPPLLVDRVKVYDDSAMVHHRARHPASAYLHHRSNLAHDHVHGHLACPAMTARCETSPHCQTYSAPAGPCYDEVGACHCEHYSSSSTACCSPCSV